MKVSKVKSLAFFLPFFLLFFLFWLIPFLYGIYTSLHQAKLTTGLKEFIGIENYIRIFSPGSMHAENFLLGLKNTLIFVGISVIPILILSLGLALLLDRLRSPWKQIFRTIFFISYAVSVTAVAAIFIWLLNGNGGYINNLMMQAGLISNSIPWLEAQPFAWISLVIATLWWTCGFNMMLFVNALNEIDTALFEAASLDGAGYWQQFKAIIWPGIREVFFFVLMTTIIASFNLYGQANLMTKGGPGQSTKPLIMTIYQTIMDGKNLGVGTAMAVVMGIVVMVFVFLQNFLTKKAREYGEVRK